MARILTRREHPRDPLRAISVDGRGTDGSVVVRLENGTENVYLGASRRVGTQWLAIGHRTMDPATARLIAQRLNEAADTAEREAGHGA